jgi:hypothetical protein
MQEQRLNRALSADRASGQKPGLETAFGFDDDLPERGRGADVDGQEDGRGNVWHRESDVPDSSATKVPPPNSAEAARIRLPRICPSTILQSEAHS